ncbi:fimbrial protein [Serratia fonticola]|jgi:type 1 fimbria pilin|uniref:fimbrial protein n=1 Tax=Serratia fonticola TaxID=47917 RepID=UPI00141551ED|nr:fimbrial protein [Serratia fonticola]NXZ89053.1 fimbrial protein [Serratia fonticola]QIP90028.1 hypothetical protein HAP32_00545 [Serratia fonticola]
MGDILSTYLRTIGSRFTLGLGFMALLFSAQTQSVAITTITATVVASSCVGRIVSGVQRSTVGIIDFGVINAKTKAAPVRPFSLLLSEYADGEIGCSAFRAYAQQQNIATLTFGDLSQTQLDSQGVITRYSDDSASPIRIQVAPRNQEAQFVQPGGPGYITAGFNQLQYPVDFATKGQFDFIASLTGLGQAKAGSFTGALTLTVAYR